jgi:hypothetical protein
MTYRCISRILKCFPYILNSSSTFQGRQVALVMTAMAMAMVMAMTMVVIVWRVGID